MPFPGILVQSTAASLLEERGQEEGQAPSDLVPAFLTAPRRPGKGFF